MHYTCKNIASALLLFLFLANLGVSAPVFAQNAAELAHYKRRIERRPDDIVAHIEYQDLMLKMDRRQEAIREYRALLEKNSKSGLHTYLYGRLLTDPEDNLRYMKRAVDQDPDLFQARVDLGRAYYHKGEYDAAISAYQAALKLKPSSAFVRNLLGLAYYHKGYAEQAIAEYKRAIENNDRYTDAYLNLGLTYLYTGDTDEAIRVYKKALDLEGGEDDLPFIYRNLGMAYAQKGETERAEEAYRKALDIAPNYAEAYISLGNLAFNQADYRMAIDNYAKAVKSRPDDPDLRLKLGLSYFNRESFDNAIQNLQKAVELDSTQTDAYYYLGLASFNEGRNDLAMNALETYVEKEKRFAKNPVVFKAKQLIEDLKRIRIRNRYSP